MNRGARIQSNPVLICLIQAWFSILQVDNTFNLGVPVPLGKAFSAW